ncbi:MAG: MBL fold metallo-hydrolase [Candidatus Gallimonas sp.]
MKISYLGTGAAEGVPALFCNCDYCKGVRERGGREIRSRSQILIDGDLSVDFPPDAFYHAARFGIDLSAVRYLLVTHSHMDHFYAHDFILRGYKYGKNLTSPTLDVYGNREVAEVYAECTRREMRREIGEGIRLHLLTAFEETAFGAYRVLPLKARHSSENPFVFLIEKGEKRVLHLTDTGMLPDETVSALARAGRVDLINFDCTFLFDAAPQPRRHMCLEENKELYERFLKSGVADERTVRVATHFSHNGVPSPENVARAEAQYAMTAAYDGMEIAL